FSDGGVVAGALITKQRCIAERRVIDALVAVTERSGTDSRIIAAAAHTDQRLKTDRGIVFSAGNGQESILALGGVPAGITSIWRWIDGSGLRRKRKADECDENWQNCCVFGLSQRIHGSSFLFPRYVDSAIRGSRRAKNLAGKCPAPDSDAFSDSELGKNPVSVSSQNAKR